MAIEIKEVTTRGGLRRFVSFPNRLYKGYEFYIPSLEMDEMNMLRRDKNPAFDFCEAAYFLAYRDGEIVGRIAAIINHENNRKESHKRLRFGFVDFIDDDAVVDALFSTAEKWGAERGMTEINGPLGFTDMDPEGMLVDGFDKMGTMVAIYNHSYYPEQLERLGFRKDADWVEYLITIPEQVPEKHQRIANLVAEKYGLRTVRYTSRKRLAEDFGHKLFTLVNESYDVLYGYTPLTERQIKYYVDMYIPMLRLENLVLVVDKDNELVAMGVGMPSIAKALQKSGGRLFPFGFIHLLKALKGKNDLVELLLFAVKPEYQNKGVNALVFRDIIPAFNSNGYRFAESNPELEMNVKVQNQWGFLEHKMHKRRRAFVKDINL